MSNTTIKLNLQVSKKQYKHASRVLRTNGWSYTISFFQSYPERIVLLNLLENQKNDKLADKAYAYSVGFSNIELHRILKQATAA
jgi:hypothetical protein